MSRRARVRGAAVLAVLLLTSQTSLAEDRRVRGEILRVTGRDSSGELPKEVLVGLAGEKRERLLVDVASVEPADRRQLAVGLDVALELGEAQSEWVLEAKALLICTGSRLAFCEDWGAKAPEREESKPRPAVPESKPMPTEPEDILEAGVDTYQEELAAGKSREEARKAAVAKTKELREKAEEREAAEARGPAGDARKDARLSFFSGVQLNSFAAGNVLNYLNGDESNETKESVFAGVAFQGRMARGRERFGRSYRRWARGRTLGQADAPEDWLKSLSDEQAGAQLTLGAARAGQLWAYGEVLYGTRPADVDCAETQPKDAMGDLMGDGSMNASEQCRMSGFDPMSYDPENPQNSLAIIRDAETLEATAGVRWEWPLLIGRKADADWLAKPYLKAQVGLLSRADDGGDAESIHHVGIGIQTIRGAFEDSYFEAGWGRNDLFTDSSKDRFRLGGHVSYRPKKWKNTRAFLDLVADVDVGRFSDSFVTRFGLDWDFGDKFFPGLGEKEEEGYRLLHAERGREAKGEDEDESQDEDEGGDGGEDASGGATPEPNAANGT